MKTIAISSFFVLFALAAVVATTPAAFADHSEVTVEAAINSQLNGCQDTDEGCYVPSVATVDAGGVVIFTNPDTAAHTYTAGTPAGGQTGEFDSGLILAGASWQWTADVDPGEYPYFCIVHPWMEGTIIVQEAGAMKDPDEHGHDGDKMRMDGDTSATGMLSDGTMIKLWASEPAEGEPMEISIEFADSEHVNHDMMVTQNGEEVLSDMGAHHHEGMGTHTTAPLSSSDPVDITVTFQGYGIEEKTGPIGEEVTFSNVVPEFGTIAMMILAVAIISIIAVTSKSRVIPRL